MLALQMFWLHLPESCIQISCRLSDTGDMLTMFYYVLMGYVAYNACVTISWARGDRPESSMGSCSIWRYVKLYLFSGLDNIYIHMYLFASARFWNLHHVLKHWGGDWQNGHHVADGIFNFVNLNENVRISVTISLHFAPTCSIIGPLMLCLHLILIGRISLQYDSTTSVWWIERLIYAFQFKPSERPSIMTVERNLLLKIKQYQIICIDIYYT